MWIEGGDDLTGVGLQTNINCPLCQRPLLTDGQLIWCAGTPGKGNCSYGVKSDVLLSEHMSDEDIDRLLAASQTQEEPQIDKPKPKQVIKASLSDDDPSKNQRSFKARLSINDLTRLNALSELLVKAGEANRHTRRDAALSSTLIRLISEGVLIPIRLNNQPGLELIIKTLVDRNGDLSDPLQAAQLINQLFAMLQNGELQVTRVRK